MSERIQKLLSGLGYGSRREVEEWVAEGRLTVNGSNAEVGQKISEADTVKLDGKRLSLQSGNEPMRVLLYKKRTGEMVTREDPEGRRTVFRKLPDLETGRWIAVGRLDVNTSGLLIMTNHGELARRLMHPSFEQQREYAVRALGDVGDDVFQQLRKGVVLEDGDAKFNSIRFGDNEAELDTSDDEGEGEGTQGRANHWFIVTISEGRHREVRRLFESQGLTVNRLIRTGYGPIKLGRGIKSGSYREATAEEITKLLDAVSLPHSERLPERVRESHQMKSEFSRSGPNALPKPGKKAAEAGGWTRASPDERKSVERDERRIEKYGEAARDTKSGPYGAGPKPAGRRSFSESKGPRKSIGERPARAAVSDAPAGGSAWKKAAPADGGDAGADQQFKARGFGAASTRSYSERGDHAAPAKPRFQKRDDAAGTGRPYKPRSDGAPVGASAWGDKPRDTAGSSPYKARPRAEGDAAPRFKPRDKPFAAEASGPRFGREGAGEKPAWKKPSYQRPGAEPSQRPAFAAKPRSGEGEAYKPRLKPKTDAGLARAYGGEKPAFRTSRDGPSADRRPSLAKSPARKFVVRDGQALNAGKPRLGVKRKPDAEE